MSITKTFKIKADCIIESKNIFDLLTKLGKFLWNIGDKKEEQRFEKILKQGEIRIETPLSNDPEIVIIDADKISIIN